MSNQLARRLMDEFLQRTGVTSDASSRRYLWTDAFAVCNLLGFALVDSEARFGDLATTLVDQVHHTLGQHRADDPRRGWISGLDAEQGEQSPTRGGLRIGKPLSEPAPGEKPDPRLHWDQDGQYFHYLTKWMHALYHMSQEQQEAKYLSWAKELATTAHRAFTYRTPAGELRMVWKMSIDLSRPLDSSMGHHDPLDGLVSFLQLQSANSDCGVDLDRAIADMSHLCQGIRWATDDALGIGGLLNDAGRLGRLVLAGQEKYRDLLLRLLNAAEASLHSFSRSSQLNVPATQRLAFRELGLAIGLHAIERLRPIVQEDPQIADLVSDLARYAFLAEQIESFWSDARHRSTNNWTAHEDINSVMLATALQPQGYLAP